MQGGQRTGGLATLALVSGVYDLALAVPMLLVAPRLAEAMGAPPPVPLINAQLNGVFTLSLAAGYFWAARDVEARRGYLWGAGVLAKGPGGALFVLDHFPHRPPATLPPFAGAPRAPATPPPIPLGPRGHLEVHDRALGHGGNGRRDRDRDGRRGGRGRRREARPHLPFRLAPGALGLQPERFRLVFDEAHVLAHLLDAGARPFLLRGLHVAQRGGLGRHLHFHLALEVTEVDAHVEGSLGHGDHDARTRRPCRRAGGRGAGTVAAHDEATRGGGARRQDGGGAVALQPGHPPGGARAGRESHSTGLTDRRLQRGAQVLQLRPGRGGRRARIRGRRGQGRAGEQEDERRSG